MIKRLKNSIYLYIVSLKSLIRGGRNAEEIAIRTGGEFFPGRGNANSGGNDESIQLQSSDGFPLPEGRIIPHVR